MNNYEQRLFLDYFYKMFDSISFGHSFGRMFHSFCDIFNQKNLRLDYDKIDHEKSYNYAQEDTFRKNLKKELFNLKSKIKVKTTLFEKKLNIIKEVYSLNKEEFVVLEFLLSKNFDSIFKKLYDCLSNSTVSDFLHAYLKIEYYQSERINSSLYSKGIISGEDFDFTEKINSNILEVLDNSKCNTPTKMTEVLLGHAEKSSLTELDFQHIEPKLNKVIKIIKSAIDKNQKGVNILLHGNIGIGKTEFAKLVANLASIPIFAIKTENDRFKEANREDRLIDLCSKQHILSRTKNACVLFDEAEDVLNRGFSEFGKASKGYLNKVLENNAVPTIWTTNNICNVDPAFLRRMTYAIEFEDLSEENRLNIWKKILKKNKFKVKNSKIEELNKSYNIPPSLIANAVQSTKMIDGNENDFEDFIENVARVVTKKKNVKTKKSLAIKDYDINLINTDIDMNDLTEKIKKTGKLNFSLCLYGEPGTGKSLYARYLASELGVEVISKKASDLISMWVGETEQNIADAFSEAKSKKAMLIIDEADSFLQNRNNAQRSWEISQVNEMLTWMESHEYPFVCTTNLLDSLDEASLRRFTFKVRYDFLSKKQVNCAMEHFFGIKNANIEIKGLTAGDFATVKKKIDFLEIKDLDEIVKMLNDEVKLKKSKILKNTIGF